MSGILMKDAKTFLYDIQKNLDPSELAHGSTSIAQDRKNVLDLKIVVMVDISGSISQRQFQQFMRQIDAIRGLSMVKVIETDTKVVAMYDYFKERKNRMIRLQGGGGTEFIPAFKAAKEMEPHCILVMTDGEIFDNVPDPRIPTGWILTHGGKKPFNFGKVVVELPPPHKGDEE
jgi:predicted metal-dependent peptidase